MINTLIVLLGIPVMLIGLVGMGPQVNVHRIRPWSVAAWVFRVGSALMIIGLLLSLSGGLDRAIITVSLIMGTACVTAYAVILHHEWIQAGHVEQPDFQLHFSPIVVVLSLVTIVCGAILIIGIAAGWMSSTLQWLIIIEMVMGFLLLVSVQESAERRRANFALNQTFSLQAYVVGVIVMVVGLILLVKTVQ